MRKLIPLFGGLLLFSAPDSRAQRSAGRIDSFRIHGDIKITKDIPADIRKSRETVVIFFALPNGNSTEQTMGKRMRPGDDWHFDIQHIRAQTAFIRLRDKRKNYAVIYLENDYKSWPSWKQNHTDFRSRIPALIDSLAGLIPGKKKSIYLNGHSGGGSFIFGFLAGLSAIPETVKRISFIDSNYGYDSSYYPVIRNWIQTVKGAALNVFAYNDSVALYNGKPVVSARGGTWYRSHLMLQHFQRHMTFNQSSTDSLEIFKSSNEQVQFFFKSNHDRGIYHTQQVELNGFIHSVFCGTRHDSRGYRYYGGRAYSEMITE